MALFFDAGRLPKAKNEYVAWVDVMGTQEAMSRSLSQSANFIFKLHVAAISAVPAVKLYPVMDGFYAAAEKQRDMLDFLNSVFSTVGADFANQENLLHRFIIRGGLAFGPVVHGSDVPDPAAPAFVNQKEYRNSILLGLPIVQAHICEGKAPPFGIFVHESARSFSPEHEEAVHFSWWRWRQAAPQLWDSFGEKLSKHFDSCNEGALELNYSADRIKVHREMARQYFANSLHK